MSGLQSSISVHIARNYLHPDGQWGPNEQLFWTAVGNHQDRLDNMYFTFLFLLRAVVRAKDTILAYPYYTGNAADDLAVKELLHKLLATATSSTSAAAPVKDQQQQLSGDVVIEDLATAAAMDECRSGFDETDMFQVRIRCGVHALRRGRGACAVHSWHYGNNLVHLDFGENLFKNDVFLIFLLSFFRLHRSQIF
jgi:hypothetical protein